MAELVAQLEGTGAWHAGLGVWAARVVRLKKSVSRRPPHLTGTVRRGRLSADPLCGGGRPEPAQEGGGDHARARPADPRLVQRVRRLRRGEQRRAGRRHQRRALRREAPEDRPPRRCRGRLQPPSLPTPCPPPRPPPRSHCGAPPRSHCGAPSRSHGGCECSGSQRLVHPPPCTHRSGGLPRVLRAALVAREGSGGP